MTDNTDQIDFWNGKAGEQWVRYQDIQDAMLRPHGDAALDAAGLKVGERVIDVGCGCGDSTLEIAKRVSPGGQVLGIDISDPMVAHARERAETAEFDAEVTFSVSDASTEALAEGDVDAVYSRLGVMFFADPVPAFENIRRWLKPGGRLAFCCWRQVKENPWVTLPMQVARKHLDLPSRKSEGYTPGPFGFADDAFVASLLQQSGFTLDAIDRCDRPIGIGGGLENATLHAMYMTPMSGALADAGDSIRAVLKDDMMNALAPHLDGDCVVLDAATWIVTAHT